MSEENRKKTGLQTAYSESDSVKAAGQALAEHQAAEPAAYSGAYDSRLSELMDRIENRQAFHYDSGSDALYQNYKQNYVNLGKTAMKDTAGQAAALTGGYGSSYAQTAGQQQYNSYLQELTGKIPELYDRALQAYQAEGDRLQSSYDALSAADASDYSRWRDSVSDWSAKLDYLTDRYDTARSEDRSAALTDYQDRQALAREQALYLAQNGSMPNVDLLALSGYDESYIAALIAAAKGSGSAASSSSGSSSAGSSAAAQANKILREVK